jgi:hypothetical protein
MTLMFLLLLPNMAAFGVSSPVYSIETKDLGNNRVQADVNFTNAEDIYGAQIYVNFNKEALNAVEILKGNIIVDGDPSVKLIQQKIDNTNGYILYAITKIGVSTKNASSGTLFSIIFDKKSSNNYGLYIGSKSVISDESGNNIAVVQDSAASEATLKDIRIGTKTISSFSSYNTNYSVEKSAALIANPKVIAIPTNVEAKVVVQENATNKNIINIKVISQNGNVTKEYVINFIVPVIVENITGTSAFKADESSRAAVKVTNNKNNKVEVTLLTAVFDKDGSFVTYTAAQQTINPGKSAEINAMLGSEYIKKGYLVKCFVIDSFDRMYPYSNVIEIPVQ